MQESSEKSCWLLVGLSLYVMRCQVTSGLTAEPEPTASHRGRGGDVGTLTQTVQVRELAALSRKHDTKSPAQEIIKLVLGPLSGS